MALSVLAVGVHLGTGGIGCGPSRRRSLPFVVLAAALPVQTQRSGVPSVTDGDNLKIGAHRIRLRGFDAPESRQTCRAGGETWSCGTAATRALRERFCGRPVACAERDRNRYGRIVAATPPYRRGGKRGDGLAGAGSRTRRRAPTPRRRSGGSEAEAGGWGGGGEAVALAQRSCALCYLDGYPRARMLWMVGSPPSNVSRGEMDSWSAISTVNTGSFRCLALT